MKRRWFKTLQFIQKEMFSAYRSCHFINCFKNEEKSLNPFFSTKFLIKIPNDIGKDEECFHASAFMAVWFRCENYVFNFFSYETLQKR